MASAGDSGWTNASMLTSSILESLGDSENTKEMLRAVLISRCGWSGEEVIDIRLLRHLLLGEGLTAAQKKCLKRAANIGDFFPFRLLDGGEVWEKLEYLKRHG